MFFKTDQKLPDIWDNFEETLGQNDSKNSSIWSHWSGSNIVNPTLIHLCIVDLISLHLRYF